MAALRCQTVSDSRCSLQNVLVSLRCGIASPVCGMPTRWTACEPRGCLSTALEAMMQQQGSDKSVKQHAVDSSRRDAQLP